MKLNSKFTKSLIAVSLISFVMVLALPMVASAQLNTTAPTNANFGTQFFGCTPSTGNSQILCILRNILSFILAIAFIVAVIFLVVGGFRYIVSQGNEEGVEKAKGTITNAVIGIVVIVLAWVILQVVFALVNTGNAGT